MRKKAINITPMSAVVRRQLEKKGMTQAELAQRTGISPVTIHYLLENKRRYSPHLIVRISLILGIDAIELGRMQSDYEIMQVIQPIIDEEEK